MKNEESKYYTPTIESFHVGFEYEFSVEDGVWTKASIKDGTQIDDIHVIFRDIPAYKLRVKHLCREDIESLDWEYVPFIPQGEQGDRWYDEHVKGSFNMTSGGVEPNEVVIFKYKEEYHRAVFFKGTVNNKSELVKILKMIGNENQD